jgi:hypothetical protein
MKIVEADEVLYDIIEKRVIEAAKSNDPDHHITKIFATLLSAATNIVIHDTTDNTMKIFKTMAARLKDLKKEYNSGVVQ